MSKLSKDTQQRIVISLTSEPAGKELIDAIESNTTTSPVLSVNAKTGHVVLDKNDIDLENVDNTSDANKPISSATQSALDLITNVNWTGDYDNGRTYNVGDGVMFNGASFRMINFIGAAGYIPPAYPGNWVQVTDYLSVNLDNKANTNLDNLVSTSIPDGVHLRSMTTGFWELRTKTVDLPDEVSGSIYLRSGSSFGPNGISGNIEIFSGNTIHRSGNVEIYSGAGNTETGSVTIRSNDCPSGGSGNISIRTGYSPTRGSITLDGSYISASSSQIKNVADAVDDNDAVNLSQLETITNDLEDRVVSLEDNSNVSKVYAYEDNLQVRADGQPGVKDPSPLIRDGWYYKNLVAGQKINWYYFDGLNQGTVTLGDLKSVYAVMTFDAVRVPILAIYTVPTGAGDALPPFAHSRIVYDETMTPTPVIGKKYLVYGGEEPSVHPELPRIQLTLVPAQSVGEKLPTEQILTVSFGSDSGASVNSVQYMVETLGLFSDPVKHEMDLRIRVGSQLELDNKANKDLSNLVTTSIPAGVNLESVSSAFTVKTKNQTSAGSGEMLLRSGDVTTTYPSGGVYIASGSNPSANAATSSTTSTGGLYLYTGDLLGTQGSSGHIEMLTGYVLSNNFTGNTGSINVGSGWIQGSNCTGNTGATLVWSGTILNSTSVGDTGVVSVYSGNNAGTGNSGNVSVYTGTVASGARGFVSLDGSYITVNSKQIKDVADGTANNDAVNVSQLNNAIASSFEDIEQPVGLKDPTQVALSIDDSLRTLTVAPTGASFVCFVKGKKITISSSLQSTWPNTPGLHFFYIDQTGSLITTTTFTDAIITEYSFVSMVYWDDVAAKHIIFANEKHGMKMSPITHAYLHRTRGAAFDSGGKLVNFVVDGGGSSNTHAQFTSNLGVIWDEDIRIPYPAQAQIPVFYKSGASGLWKRKEANSFPLIISGEEGYTGASGLIPYNHFNGSSWVLSEASNNKFVLVHIFATNDIEFPVIAIQGQVEYNNKNTARKGALTEIRELSGLPVYEFCPLGSVIYQTSNAYTNTPKAQVVSTADGDDYEDHRLDSIRPGSLA
jgi:hypothetical protein